MPFRRMGRPGLVGMAARTAVVAGTATAVSGSVQRHQAEKAAGPVRAAAVRGPAAAGADERRGAAGRRAAAGGGGSRSAGRACGRRDRHRRRTAEARRAAASRASSATTSSPPRRRSCSADALRTTSGRHPARGLDGCAADGARAGGGARRVRRPARAQPAGAAHRRDLLQRVGHRDAVHRARRAQLGGASRGAGLLRHRERRAALARHQGAQRDLRRRGDEALRARPRGRRSTACPGIEASDITHVVTVSCTGFYAPGPDFMLVRELGLGAGRAALPPGVHGLLRGDAGAAHREAVLRSGCRGGRARRLAPSCARCTCARRTTPTRSSRRRCSPTARRPAS